MVLASSNDESSWLIELYVWTSKRLIYTIGFENKSQEEFLHQLMRNGVGLVIDVRLNNCSEKDGYVTLPTISNLLEHESIIYKNDRMLAPDDQIRKVLEWLPV